MVSRFDTEEHIAKLHKEGKTTREISKAVHKNFSYIGTVLRKRFPDEYPSEDNSKKTSLETQALKLFYKEKGPVYVTIKLPMKPEDVNKLYLQYLQMEGLQSLVNMHNELRDSLPSFVKSYKKILQSGLSIDKVISIVQNQSQMPQIEKQYNELCENVRNLYQLKFSVTGEINRLRNQIMQLQNYLSSLKSQYVALRNYRF